MTVAPDLRAGVGAVHERIVGRHRTVGVHAHDAAEMIGQVLRGIELEALAHREEQVPVRREHDASAEVIRTVDPRLLAKDDLEILHAVVDQTTSAQRGRRAAVAGLGVGQVDQAVLVEIRVECHIQQPALPFGIHLGGAFDRRGQIPGLIDEVQIAAAALAHEQSAVGQEGDAPRAVQAVNQPLDRDRSGFGRHRPDLGGFGGKRMHGDGGDERERRRHGGAMSCHVGYLCGNRMVAAPLQDADPASGDNRCFAGARRLGGGTDR